MKRVAQISRKIEVHNVFHLGNGVHVQVIFFKGKPKIDIRMWFQKQNDGWRPTKRGIRLSPSNWTRLLQTYEDLDVDILDVTKKRTVSKFYLIGDNTYASITSPRWKIDLRVWNLGADRVLRPGWKGITLNFSEWRKLMELSPRINLARARMQM